MMNCIQLLKASQNENNEDLVHVKHLKIEESHHHDLYEDIIINNDPYMTTILE